MARTKSIDLRASYEVAFSPDGQSLAVLGRDVVLWDVTTGEKRVRAHPCPHPSHLAFSPTGDRLAVKSTVGRIVVLDADTAHVVVDFHNNDDGEGSNLQFSPCGAYIVDGSWNGTLSVRDAASGQRTLTATYPLEMIRGVHRSADGAAWIISHGRIATSSSKPPADDYFTAWSWPLRTGGGRVLRRRFAFLRSSALATDARRLALVHGAPPDRVVVLDLPRARTAGSFPASFGGCGGGLAWSPDGTMLTCAEDGQFGFYRTSDLALISTYPMEYACSVAFSPTGRHVALGSWSSGRLLRTEEIAGITSA